MAIYLKKEFKNGDILGLWEIREALDDLKEKFIQLSSEVVNNDMLIADEFISEKRKKEWLSTRLLIDELIGYETSIEYDENGRPLLKDRKYNISISHSHDFVAVLISCNNKIGIDIEQISSKIANIAIRFLNNLEQENISSDDLRKLYLHWSAKETIYKVYSKGGLSFKENIKVLIENCRQEGKFTGFIKIEDYKEKLDLNYFFLAPEEEAPDEYVVVWTSMKDA